MTRWKKEPLIFHYTKTEVTTMTIPENSEIFETSQLFIAETLPIKLLIAFPLKDAYYGDYK